MVVLTRAGATAAPRTEEVENNGEVPAGVASGSSIYTFLTRRQGGLGWAQPVTLPRDGVGSLPSCSGLVAPGAVCAEVAAAAGLAVAVACLALFRSLRPHLPSADWNSSWPSKRAGVGTAGPLKTEVRGHTSLLPHCVDQSPLHICPITSWRGRSLGLRVSAPSPNRTLPLITCPRKSAAFPANSFLLLLS